MWQKNIILWCRAPFPQMENIRISHHFGQKNSQRFHPFKIFYWEYCYLPYFLYLQTTYPIVTLQKMNLFKLHTWSSIFLFFTFFMHFNERKRCICILFCYKMYLVPKCLNQTQQTIYTTGEREKGGYSEKKTPFVTL